MKKIISIIIPFLNEEENIPFLVTSISEYFGEKKMYDVEVIYVNDGSTDNSIQILQNQNHILQTKIISLSKNYGSHAALRAGIFHATGDFIAFMYADLQDPLDLIDKMFEQTINGNEIIWASRKEEESSKSRFSRWYAKLMKKYVIETFPENGFDVVLFSKNVASYINQNIESNSSIFIQILTLGFQQFSICYEKQTRKFGTSKWTFQKKIKLFIDSFVAFSYAPIRFVTYIGISLFLIGCLWTTYLIARTILYHDLVSGWPTLISILLIGFGITNISLGIIAEYLWRTLDSSRKRPVFIVEKIIDIKK
jgi:polyisoprenyl-phosphate glycosyltransferase